MSMYLGIDLGSTTTKAVLLDDEERILGCGITNTRSNYHVATAVAQKEAENNARFTTLRRKASTSGVEDKTLDTLEDFFTLESFLFRLRRLREFAIEHADQHFPGNRRLQSVLEAILNQIEAMAGSSPDFSNQMRTSFFRDLVGASFMTLAETKSAETGLDFEEVMGIYDVVILREENSVVDLAFAKTLTRCPEVSGANGSTNQRLVTAIEEAANASFDPENMVGTGYGRQRLPFREDQIRSEILCHGLGSHFQFPDTRTVLDIGGQDTKAIQVDSNGVATNFQMNDRCAAGCGRYLGYVADELNISLDELGPLALQASRTVPISSTCTVFAGAELRERLELGEKREDILAGLHRAIVLRAMSLLARSGGVKNQFTFTGGVSRNQAAVKVLKELVEENYGSLITNVHETSIYMGALGAALYAHRDLHVPEPTSEARR